MINMEDVRKEEIMTWTLIAVQNGLRTARGGNLFGGRAEAKIVDHTIQIKTHQVGIPGPVYYELRLVKPFS